MASYSKSRLGTTRPSTFNLQLWIGPVDLIYSTHSIDNEYQELSNLNKNLSEYFAEEIEMHLAKDEVL